MPTKMIEDGFTHAGQIKSEFLNYNPFLCCELIAAYNALIYFGADRPTRSELNPLIKKYKCRYGSVIGIEEMWYDLGLEIYRCDFTLEGIAANLPVGILVESKKLGRHKALIVGIKDKNLYIPNMGGPIVWPWNKIKKMGHRWQKGQAWVYDLQDEEDHEFES